MPMKHRGGGWAAGLCSKALEPIIEGKMMTVPELQSLLVSGSFLAVLPKATQRSLFLALHGTVLTLIAALHGHSY